MPVAEIRALNLQTDRTPAKPVMVQTKGVVTWTSATPTTAFGLADESAGIYVGVDPQHKETGASAVQMGAEVEVVGEVVLTGYAPYILPRQVRVLGHKGIPPPMPLSVERLLSGAYDSQRVAVDCVVESVYPDPASEDFRLLRCAGIAGQFLARVDKAEWNDALHVVDASVRVSGFVITLCNARQEMTGTQISVRRREDFVVMRPPPADPFSIPFRSLDRLLPFSPKGARLHRCKVAGTVTLVSDDQFWIQEGNHGMRIRRWYGDSIQPGDCVEVIGFVGFQKPVANLHDAVIRKRPATTPVSPISISMDEILAHDRDGSWSGWRRLPVDFEGRLVQMQGTVIGPESISGIAPSAEQGLALVVGMPSGRTMRLIFPAGVNLPESIGAAGCVLQATGVADLKYGPNSKVPDYQQPVSLDLRLRGLADITILKAAPFWTQERLKILATGSGALVIILGGWTWWLRQHLKKQAEELAEVRAVEAAHAGTMAERGRLAGELHDGVQQIIAGASLHLEGARHALPKELTTVSSSLDTARQLVMRIRDEVRRSIWAMRELEDTNGDLHKALRSLVSTQRLCSEALVEMKYDVDRQVKFPQQAITAFVLITQEAINNALKHGRARRIDINVCLRDQVLAMTIVDDGCGFEISKANGVQAGHLGLTSMKDRAARIGGALSVTSKPGNGTSVCATLSLGQSTLKQN